MTVDVGYNDEIDSVVLQRMSAMNRRQPRELWVKPVPEVKYLNADNVGRYRLIMRFFYDNYRKLKYWLKPEEVFAGISAWNLLDDYTLELCQRDLDVLTEWRNLTSSHDGGRAGSIEEYLRKRYRYQMTPYAIEIERMLESLESIQGYGGSLEPTLLERIVVYVRTVAEHTGQFAPGEALQLWRDLQAAFRTLHENASDYLASLQTTRAEELMLTEQFLVFKDTLTNYLQNFMLGLQKYGAQVEGLIRRTEPAKWRTFLAAVVEDEMRTPSLDDVLSAEERLNGRLEEWAILTRWFVGSDIEESDVVFLERATKDTIGRMVRYVIAIQEKQRLGISRRRELDYLGQWFLRLDSVEDAHKLGAAVYGLMKPRHFQGEPPRGSDSPDLSMWDEAPMVRELTSRSRVRRKAGSTEPVRSREGEQAEARQVLLAQMEQEAAVVRGFAELGNFHLSDLDVLSTEQRRVLLSWISRCLVNKARRFRTADGYHIELALPESDERAELTFSDGQLDMPNFHISIREATRS